jgi:hypothetical protein
MRTPNELERLAAAGRPLIAAADSLAGAAEEDRILERVLASPRPIHRRPIPARRLALLIAVVAGVIAAIAALTGPDREGGHRIALKGAQIKLAGYRFKTPAGFEDSNATCGPSATERFSAAASADGGCVEAFFMISSNGSPVPDGSTPVDVGAYHGHLVSESDSDALRLYVDLPPLSGISQDVVLFGQGLTSEQLVAIAESGLPATPSGTVG